MEVVTGALSSLLPKLGELLVGEYNLQKEAKGGIRFLQTELETMKAALEDISRTHPDRLNMVDKIWARDVRELSYDIEDSIDTFMAGCDGNKQHPEPHGYKKVIDKSLHWLMQPKIRRKIALEIRDIRSCVEEVSGRRDRYEIRTATVAKPVTIDPRVVAPHRDGIDLVGIDEARDELIKILMEAEQVLSGQQEKIVSIVGSGGLGKTTLANVVYEKLRSQFHCSAFVSVSQTPDMDKLFNDMMYQLVKKNHKASVDVAIRQLRDLLKDKSYFIVIDDIWDLQHWMAIRCALPLNDVGCKIITTTRIANIAEKVGGAFYMRPLSLQNSRALMHRRIFGNKDKDKCPDGELTNISDRVLNKCAGVPLAIITIASLLANKGGNKMEWYAVCDSVGTGMKNNFDLDNMRKILSFSYYELPSHLRTCLMYFSMFPEDYRVDKDRLVWMWIAEGFVQYGTQGQSLFEVGERYLNELIDRSLVQPVYDKRDGRLIGCHVHDMMLDVICSLSREENFIVILNREDQTYPSKNIRRLSLQNSNAGRAMLRTDMGMQQVRSVAVITSDDVDILSALSRFRVLRVLDLQDCDISQHCCSLKYLGNLHQMRYLALGRTSEIIELPTEIGNLRLLQTLDMSRAKISNLPSTILQLKHLMCLYTSPSTQTIVPNGIGSLTSLEELNSLDLNGEDSTAATVEELGQLTELRVLHLSFVGYVDEALGEYLVESINKLQKIQCLCISSKFSDEINLDGWVVAPRHLRDLRLRGCCFSRLPAWVRPSLLVDLMCLTITMRELRQEDLEILGALLGLRYLQLDRLRYQGFKAQETVLAVAPHSFPCLLAAEFRYFRGHVLFRQGAMPRLTRLRIPFCVEWVGDIGRVDDLGLENLPLLQEIVVDLHFGGTNYIVVVRAKAALRLVAEIHPNRPEIWIREGVV